MNLMRQLALFKQTMQTEGLSAFQSILRTMMVLISILLMIFTLISGSGSKGLILIKLISYVNNTFILVATVNLFCSCITEEKEGGTLGLLLMTGLSPFGLIIGKSLSRLYLVLQLLLLQLPLIFLSVTQGGVKSIQVLALVVFCLAFIVFLSQLGLLFSVVCSRTSMAVCFTSISFGMYYIICAGSAADPIRWLNNIFLTNYNAGAMGLPVALMLSLGLLFLLLSILLFNPSTRANVTQVESVLKSERKPIVRFGSKAVFDKDMIFHAGGYKLLLIKIALAAGVYFFLHEAVYSYIMPYIALGWLWVEGAFHSQTIFSREIKDGTLTTLGVLPSDLGSLIVQKMWVCGIAMTPALIFSGVAVMWYFPGTGDNVVKLIFLYLFWVSHMQISALCSIYFKKMNMLMTLLYVVIFTTLYGLCPLFWLLFLPTIVLLSVNIVEKLKVELTR